MPHPSTKFEANRLRTFRKQTDMGENMTSLAEVEPRKSCFCNASQHVEILTNECSIFTTILLFECSVIMVWTMAISKFCFHFDLNQTTVTSCDSILHSCDIIVSTICQQTDGSRYTNTHTLAKFVETVFVVVHATVGIGDKFCHDYTRSQILLQGENNTSHVVTAGN